MTIQPEGKGTYFSKELQRFRENQVRAQKVEDEAISLGKLIIKHNLRNGTLGWSDVVGARHLVTLDVNIPWVHAVANADENSDLEAVTEIALMALEEEGEE